MDEPDPQWFVQCTTCDDVTVVFYCNTCGDVMCNPCKVRHERSNASKHHMIAPYAEKITVKKRACPEHKESNYILYCDVCNVPVCDVCTTDAHKGHSFSSINEIYIKKRQMVAEQVEYIKSWKVPSTKDLLEKSRKATKDYVRSMENIETSMLYTANKIKEEVDYHYERSHRTLEKEKSHYLKSLKGKEEEVQCHLTELEELSESYGACLKSEDRIALLLLARNVQDKESPTLIDATPLPEFIPGMVDKTSILKQFGKLVPSDQKFEGNEKPKRGEAKRKQIGELVQSDPKFKENEKLEQTESASEEPPEDHPVVLGTLLAKPVVQGSLTVEITGSIIACGGQNLTWTTGDKCIKTMQNPSKVATRKIKMGKEQTTMKNFFDMVVNSRDQLLISDGKNSIKRLGENRTLETMFSTGKSKPCGISSLPNDNILVAFRCERKVVLFSSTGRIVQEFMKDVLQHPMFVAYNNVTDDVCVSDAVDPYSKGKVLVFKRNGKLRFIYDSTQEYFVPQGIKTDGFGHILIADSGMGCIHVLEKYGSLLQKVQVDKNIPAMPYSIDIDKYGCIWVSEYDAKIVHVVKYLETTSESE